MIGAACAVFLCCLMLGQADQKSKPRPKRPLRPGPPRLTAPTTVGAWRSRDADCGERPLYERTARHACIEACPGTRQYKGRVPPGPRAMQHRAGAPYPCREPVRDCAPLPWLSDDVDRIIADNITGGNRDADAITCHACQCVYPVTPDGRAIEWPARNDDAPAMRALFARVGFRVKRHLAAVQDEIADDAWFARGGR